LDLSLSLQDATDLIRHIPKIVAMVAAAILLMPWMSQRLLEYSAAIFLEGRIP
jgi:flagellar biosynthesis protein FliQ